MHRHCPPEGHNLSNGNSGTDNSEAGYVYESHPCAMGIWQREDDTSDVGVLGNLPSSG